MEKEKKTNEDYNTVIHSSNHRYDFTQKKEAISKFGHEEIKVEIEGNSINKNKEIDSEVEVSEVSQGSNEQFYINNNKKLMIKDEEELAPVITLSHDNAIRTDSNKKLITSHQNEQIIIPKITKFDVKADTEFRNNSPIRKIDLAVIKYDKNLNKKPNSKRLSKHLLIETKTHISEGNTTGTNVIEICKNNNQSNNILIKNSNEEAKYMTSAKKYDSENNEMEISPRFEQLEGIEKRNEINRESPKSSQSIKILEND